MSDLRAFLRLISTLRSLSPDVVHTHMAKAGVVGRLAAWIARIPVRVHTYHGHLLYGYFSPLKTRLVVLIERILGAITTHVVVVGTTVRKELIAARIISESHSTMIPPGIADVGSDVHADRCGIGPGRLLVGFVGRLTAIKRPDRFIDMAKVLLSRRSDVEFLVVGDGPLGDEVRAATASLLSVHCVGWRRDVAPILSALDVLVLCSDNEGIPLSLIEAGQCTTAVVATDVGSVHDVVQHERTGLLVAKDPNALADAVERLLNDPALRAALAAGGREFSLSEFGVDSAQRRHRELYQRLVAAR